MRFMMLMIPQGYTDASPDATPDAKSVERMMQYNKALQDAGMLISLDGLHPPSAGARVAFKGGKATITDGPFAETKEVLGGYWIIRAASRDEAVAWAARCPAADGDVIEVRQIFDMEEFPEDVQAVVKNAGMAELS